MEDFDGDRWCRTPAADAAYKQEELAGPQQVERKVWSIMAAWQSDAPPRYSHAAHLSQFGNTVAAPGPGRPRAPTNTCLLEETSVTCPQTCETLAWGGNSGPNNQWIVRFNWLTASLHEIEYNDKQWIYNKNFVSRKNCAIKDLPCSVQLDCYWNKPFNLT